MLKNSNLKETYEKYQYEISKYIYPTADNLEMETGKRVKCLLSRLEDWPKPQKSQLAAPTVGGGQGAQGLVYPGSLANLSSKFRKKHVSIIIIR